VINVKVDYFDFNGLFPFLQETACRRRQVQHRGLEGRVREVALLVDDGGDRLVVVTLRSGSSRGRVEGQGHRVHLQKHPGRHRLGGLAGSRQCSGSDDGSGSGHGAKILTQT